MFHPMSWCTAKVWTSYVIHIDHTSSLFAARTWESVDCCHLRRSCWLSDVAIAPMYDNDEQM